MCVDHSPDCHVLKVICQSNIDLIEFSQEDREFVSSNNIRMTYPRLNMDPTRNMAQEMVKTAHPKL